MTHHSSNTTIDLLYTEDLRKESQDAPISRDFKHSRYAPQRSVLSMSHHLIKHARLATDHLVYSPISTMIPFLLYSLSVGP